MNEEQIGHFIGKIAVIALLAWGIFKNFKNLKDENTNKKSTWGLILILAAILVLFVGFYLRSNVLEKPYDFIVIAVIVFLAMNAVVAGFVLALLGLTEYKAKGFKQGKTQSIWAISISSILLVLMISGFFYGFARRQLQQKTSEPITVGSAVGAVKQFEELNFKFTVPEKPWVEVKPERINQSANFAMLNNPLKAYFLVIAEKAGMDSGLDTKGLTELARARLESSADDAFFSKNEEMEVNGVKGLHFKCDVTQKKRKWTYYFWITVRNGYYYQLVTFGDIKYKTQLHQSAERLSNRFKLLDMNKIFYGSAGKPLDSYKSPYFHYSLDVTGKGWSEWKDLEESIPQAELGAKQADDVYFAVVPFYFHDDNLPQPSLEALTQSLLKTAGIPYPDTKIKNLKKVKQGKLDGYSLDFIDKTEDGATTFLYRNKILKNKHYAYLLTYWCDIDNAKKDLQSEQLFNAVNFEGQAASKFNWSAATKKTQEAQSAIFNNLGLFYYEAKQFERSIPYFKKASALDPAYGVLHENVVSAHNRLSQFPEMLSYLDRLPPDMSKNKELRAWRAFTLTKLNRNREALRLYKTLFDEGLEDENDFIDYTNLLRNDGRADEAAAAFRKFLKKKESLNLWVAYAHTLMDREKYGEAIDIIQRRQSKLPFNTRLTYALVRAYRGKEDYKTALALCDKLIANGYDSRDSYYLKGQMEYYLKWYPKAKRSFEKALEYAPKDEDVKEYLKYVSGTLGEGSNSSIKEPIATVPIPAGVASQLPPMTVVSPREGYGAFYISRVMGLEFLPKKGLKITSYERIKVLDSAGVSKFSTLTVNFSPLNEQVYVNRLEVRDKDGQTVSQGDVADYYVTDRKNGEMATHEQTLHIPVSQLLPGCTVDFTFTRLIYENEDVFPFYETALTSTFPVYYNALFYTGDMSGIKYTATNGLREMKLEKGAVWWIKDPVLYKWEPRQDFYTTFLPVLRINHGAADWGAVGKEFLGDINDRLEMTSQVSSLARKLTKGKRDRQEKIDALVQYMQRKYTYKALEFGRRAYIPNKPGQVIANKYGDCKDHALLIHLLLKAVNIPSHLALVSLGTPVEPSLPAMDQFDHIIVYLPGTGNNRGHFIDTTDKGSSPRSKVPLSLANTHALVLDPANIRLETIPGYEPGNHGVAIKKNIEVLNHKSARVRELLVFKGAQGASLRTYLKSLNTSRYTDWAHGVLADYIKEGFKLNSVTVKHLEETKQVLTVHLDYTIDTADAAEESVFNLPAAFESWYLEETPVAKRKTAFWIQYPIVLESAAVITGPKTHELNTIKYGKKNSTEEKKGYAEWNWRLMPVGSKLETSFRYLLKPGSYEPDDYGDFVSLSNRAARKCSFEFTSKKR